MPVLSYAGKLTVVACTCGIRFAVPAELNDAALSDHGRSIYCPLGHSWHYIGETDAAREARLRKWAEDSAAAARARADQAEASLRATKGVVTRMKRRAMAGACPFGCHRTFADLQRHIVSKHADETVDTVGAV